MSLAAAGLGVSSLLLQARSAGECSTSTAGSRCTCHPVARVADPEKKHKPAPQRNRWISRRQPGPQVLEAAPEQTHRRYDAVRAALEALLSRDDVLFPLATPMAWVRNGGATTPAECDQQHVLALQLRDPPGETQEELRRKRDDYYANVGDAIRTLREELPTLFQQDLTYDIYREDIVFRDRPKNFCFKGMKNYKLIFWSLRFHGRIFFSRIYLEVQRIWQPEDNIIKMRWKVHGKPRIPWESEGCFDGVSEFKLDREGKIYEHMVDNLVLRDPPIAIKNPLFAGLNLLGGQQPQQQPCPGLWCEGQGSSLKSCVLCFSWVRMYAALLGTVQLLQAIET